MTPAELAAIVKELRGRRSGRGWSCCCPGHDDRNPSLSVELVANGHLLWHCHGGCRQEIVLDALQKLNSWPKRDRRDDGSSKPLLPSYETIRDKEARRQEERKVDFVMRLWHEGRLIEDTAGAVYLRQTRGISMPLLPPSLRFHPGLRHTESRQVWSAIVGLVKNSQTDKAQGLLGIFLRTDGSGKAPVKPSKKSFGIIRGGALRLGPITDGGELVIAEGLETALLMMLLRNAPGWAVLGASNYRSLQVPPQIRRVVVAVDNDDKVGTTNTEKAKAEQEAMAFAERLAREGRHVEVAKPKEAGRDWNDVLLASRK